MTSTVFESVTSANTSVMLYQLLTRRQSSSYRRYSAGRDGYQERERKVRLVGRKRRKTTGKSWVEKLSHKSKICGRPFQPGFSPQIDLQCLTYYSDVFFLYLFGNGYFFFSLWLGISSKMASSGGDDSTCELRCELERAECVYPRT